MGKESITSDGYEIMFHPNRYLSKDLHTKVKTVRMIYLKFLLAHFPVIYDKLWVCLTPSYKKYNALEQ